MFIKKLPPIAAVLVSAVVIYMIFWGTFGGRTIETTGPSPVTTVTIYIRHGSYREQAQVTYDPPSVRVVLGVNDTVIWINEDIVPHDIIHEPCIYNESGCMSGLKSKLLEKGESYVYRFTGVGQYNYRCSPHPWMRGVVRVDDLRP